MKDSLMELKNSPKKTKKIVCWTVAIALLVVAAAITIALLPKPEPEEALYGTAIKIEELPTMELSYPGLIMYEEGKIPLLTKKSFYMEYTANVKFGVKNLSDIHIGGNNENLILTVPHSEMLDEFNIDLESIKFTDINEAIFNPEEKEDTPKAMMQAREAAKTDVGEKFNYAQAIEASDRNVKESLEGLFGQTGKKVTVLFY